MPSLTDGLSGSQSSLIKQLSKNTLDLAQQPAIPDNLQAALDEQIGVFNEGLSPAVQSALNTQATSGIAQQENDARSRVMTEALRAGDRGSQFLPGANTARRFAPIEAATLQARSMARTTAALEGQKFLMQNRQIANNALGQGLNASLTSRGQTLSAATSVLASLTASDMESLKTTLLTSLASGGIGAAQMLLQEWLQGRGTSVSPQDAASLVQQIASGGVGASTGAAGSSALQAGLGSFGLVGPALGGGTLGATGAFGTIGPAVGGGFLDGTAAATAAASGTGGGVGGALSATGSSIMSALGTAGSFLTTNPIGWAILGGGAILTLGKTLFGLGDTHEKADQWVQGVQNPMMGLMQQTGQQFLTALDNGTLTPEMAQGFKDLVLETRDKLKGEADEFASKGGDQQTVIEQYRNTVREVFGDDFQLLLSDITVLGTLSSQGIPLSPQQTERLRSMVSGGGTAA